MGIVRVMRGSRAFRVARKKRFTCSANDLRVKQLALPFQHVRRTSTPFWAARSRKKTRPLHESPARVSRAGRVALTDSKELFCALPAPRVWGAAYLCEIMLTRRTPRFQVMERKT